MTSVEPQAQWHTVREIDEAGGQPKGSAFRCFKRLAGNLVEGRDFVVLDAARDAERIRRLKQEGRLYESTVNALMLSQDTARRIRAMAQGDE
ncbi:hypothetical protein B1C78_13210 [Thioalkalivibrio denitrificans]|uniref:Uncharacterized protein n=1 Tax=Thioalkalivibrio denitrificans TaxID=108003 RepID=A0A1V3NCW4_9GAMM|nr:hypothetical protein [Thioalkalivibrio denitrificans]OOG22937.1 hypothetical protein B1C78_13210 [Thioalkalivibrio denitrificans]